MKIIKNGEVVDAAPDFIAQVEGDQEEHQRLMSLLRPVREIHISWLRQALAREGKLSEVNAAVSAAGQEKEQLWEYATTVRINDPDVVAIAGACNIDLVAVFDLADTIRKERQGG